MDEVGELTLEDTTSNESSWQNCLLITLSQFRAQGLYCDTVIKSSDNQLFHAHLCILAAAHPKLHLQFGRQKAQHHPPYVIKTSQNSAEFEKALNFIYNGHSLNSRKESVVQEDICLGLGELLKHTK